MPYSPDSLLGDVLRNRQATAVVRKHLSGIVGAPLGVQLRHASLSQVVRLLDNTRADPAARDAFFAELATIDETLAEPPRPAETVTAPSDRYEGPEIPIGSAGADWPPWPPAGSPSNSNSTAPPTETPSPTSS